MLKAIVFDLDNTLVDFMGMKNRAVDAAIDAIRQALGAAEGAGDGAAAEAAHQPAAPLSPVQEAGRVPRRGRAVP